MIHLDSNKEVSNWSYESLVIPYVSNMKTGKIRKYYPDFMIEMKNGQKIIVEIKPSKKLGQANIKKKTAAAEQWSCAHGFTYKILTEIELKGMGIILFSDYVG